VQLQQVEIAQNSMQPHVAVRTEETGRRKGLVISAVQLQQVEVAQAGVQPHVAVETNTREKR
jgi:hypothetical protein